MEAITLYRLIHPVTLCGPWTADVSHNFSHLPWDEIQTLEDVTEMLNRRFNTSTMRRVHPPVRLDIPHFRSGTHVCATESLQKLKAWFATDGEIIRALANAGYTVMAYTVPQDCVMYSKSGTQVAFDPDDAHDKKDLTIVALID